MKRVLWFALTTLLVLDCLIDLALNNPAVLFGTVLYWCENYSEEES